MCGKPIRVSLNAIPKLIRLYMRSECFPLPGPRLFLEGDFEFADGERKYWTGFVSEEVAAAILKNLKENKAIKLARMEGSMVQRSIFLDGENAPFF